MNLNEAAFELGRLSGRTTAGALEAIQHDPDALQPLIDGAADPRRADLLALRTQLLEARQERKVKQITPQLGMPVIVPDEPPQAPDAEPVPTPADSPEPIAEAPQEPAAPAPKRGRAKKDAK